MKTAQQIIAQALSHHERGEFQQAEALYRDALLLDPDNAEALQFLGALEHQLGRHPRARELLEKAAQNSPAAAHVHTNLGEVYRALGLIDEAIAAQRRAVALDPQMPQAQANLGLTLELSGNLRDAASALAESVRISPIDPIAWTHLSRVFGKLGLFAKSAEAAQNALNLDAANLEAMENLGAALRSAGAPLTAERIFRQAAQISPRSSRAWVGVGDALREQGRHREACDAYRQALAVDPHNAVAHDVLLFCMLEAGAFTNQEIAQEHRRWAALHADGLTDQAPAHANTRDPRRRLRIGYLSPDFRAHAVARFFEPILRNHDRASFEVFLYSAAFDPDAVTARLRALADDWRDLRAASDEDAARIIRDDQIDILVDLAGHTERNRLLVMARKPAPVQFTYLGYPATTGMKSIACRFTDALADPPGMTEWMHTEKLIRLPQAFLSFDPPEAPPIAPAPDRPITFGCFNRLTKLSDATISLWAKVLTAVPDSRLLLKAFGLNEERSRQWWLNRFSNAGVDPARIHFAPIAASHADHLADYAQLDIALDPFPYHGTATTCDALWMGVPVVTLAGDAHVSRVGVSILTSARLPDLIAESHDQYIQIATTLAHDRERLKRLRTELRAMMSQSPLHNAAALTRAIEAAYRQAWQEWCER